MRRRRIDDCLVKLLQLFDCHAAVVDLHRDDRVPHPCKEPVGLVIDGILDGKSAAVRQQVAQALKQAVRPRAQDHLRRGTAHAPRLKNILADRAAQGRGPIGGGAAEDLQPLRAGAQELLPAPQREFLRRDSTGGEIHRHRRGPEPARRL